MNPSPLVSIVIPTYNREQFLLRSIDSVLNQSYLNVEIIITDNCSTDNTQSIISELKISEKRLQYFRNNYNIGPVANWIKGITHAKGEFVYLLFSDDHLSIDSIEKHINILKSNNDIAFSYSNLYNPTIDRYDYSDTPLGIYNSSSFISGEILPEKSSLSPGSPIKFPVTPACALFRKEDIRKNLRLNFDNPLNVDFSNKNHNGMGNDKALFLLTANDYRFVYHLDETLVYSSPDQFNLSTLYGGQENFYYFLVIFDFIKNKNQNYSKEWSKRCADFYCYLIFNIKFKYLIKILSNEYSRKDFITLLTTLKYLFKKLIIIFRYKMGVIKRKVIHFFK